MTSMPRPRKACSSATETSMSARGTIRGAYSTSVTSQPKSARIDVSWQPVSAAPMTQTRSGRDGQAAQVLVGQAELGPGDRQSPGPAADGDDHPIRSPRAAVGRGDRVGVDEPGVAGLLDEVDPGGADVVGDALAFIEVAGHPLGVGQGSGEVDLGPWPAQTERFPRAPVPHQARGPSQRAHRCRAAVEGGAADPPPLDERDLCAQLGGVQGGGNTGGAASDDDNAHLACSFPPPRSCRPRPELERSTSHGKTHSCRKICGLTRDAGLGGQNGDLRAGRISPSQNITSRL